MVSLFWNRSDISVEVMRLTPSQMRAIGLGIKKMQMTTMAPLSLVTLPQTKVSAREAAQTEAVGMGATEAIMDTEVSMTHSWSLPTRMMPSLTVTRLFGSHLPRRAIPKMEK